MKNKIILFAIFAMGLLFIAGCGNITAQAIQQDEVELTGEIVEIEMIAKQWEFVPGTVEVNLGDKVELHIESTDVEHGFMLPDFGINERLPVGEDVHIEFVADKKGTFLFACSVPCGSGHGRMTGQLIVK